MYTRGVTTSRTRVCILARVVLVSLGSFETLLFTNFGQLMVSTLGIPTVLRSLCLAELFSGLLKQAWRNGVVSGVASNSILIGPLNRRQIQRLIELMISPGHRYEARLGLSV